MTVSDFELACFGAGCFWGVEATFRNVEGVRDVTVGYTGGALDNPTYEQVCTDQTGHAEVVQIKFDPSAISYEDLVRVFFDSHDPTQFNRQGPDFGRQYRSAIFTHSDKQAEIARAILADLVEQNIYTNPVVTVIEPASTYYPAEDYHQRYLEKRGLVSCRI